MLFLILNSFINICTPNKKRQNNILKRQKQEQKYHFLNFLNICPPSSEKWYKKTLKTLKSSIFIHSVIKQDKILHEKDVSLAFLVIFFFFILSLFQSVNGS